MQVRYLEVYGEGVWVEEEETGKDRSCRQIDLGTPLSDSHIQQFEISRHHRDVILVAKQTNVLFGSHREVQLLFLLHYV